MRKNKLPSLHWCANQKLGFSLDTPSENLRKSYFQKADVALEILHKIRDSQSNEWKVCTSYYAMYDALYAIMRKIGIKCEIHTCSLRFLNDFFQNYLSKEEIEIIILAQKTRVDLQYYTDRKANQKEIENIIAFAPKIVAKMKKVSSSLTQDSITKIREEVKEL